MASISRCQAVPLSHSTIAHSDLLGTMHDGVDILGTKEHLGSFGTRGDVSLGALCASTGLVPVLMIERSTAKNIFEFLSAAFDSS